MLTIQRYVVASKVDLLQVGELQDALDRAKDLLLGDAHVVGHSWENCFLKKTFFFPEKTVGWMKKPISPSPAPPASRVAPSLFPASMNPRILSRCTPSIWGPCSTPSSQGSPTLLALAMAAALFTNSSWIPACTRVRLPAQQFWPWLANRALWAISTFSMLK